MNILDENIDAFQRQRLRDWKIHFKRIGDDVGWLGMKDIDDIIPLLHSLKRVTFMTLDNDFYKPFLRHTGYCLVFFDVKPNEASATIKRFLRHQAFRTQVKRMGKVVRVHPAGISFWQVGEVKEKYLFW